MISCAARAIARARRVSSRPSLWFTSADARLMIARARMIGFGMRSSPMRKLRRERSVWAPHRRSAGTSIGPKVSVSVRVFMGFADDWERPPVPFSLSPLLASLSSVVGPLFLAEAVEPHDFAPADGLVRPVIGRRLALGGLRYGRDRWCRASRLVLGRRPRRLRLASRRRGRLRRGRIRRGLGNGLELHAELHRGIGETLDRRKWDA